jgi:hypothetical protein
LAPEYIKGGYNHPEEEVGAADMKWIQTDEWV